MSEICVTLDVDWAPEGVLEEVLRELDDSGVRATLFATHESGLLTSLEPGALEVALHPHFTELSDPGATFDALREVYPRARGMRSHGLMMSSAILQAGADRGLVYESNHFLPGHPGLRPVFRFDNLLTIPFYWSDDDHLRRRRPFDLDELLLDAPGLKVLNFHPIHVFMNTESPEHYAAFKQHYQEVAELRRLRDTHARGTATLFRAVLERVSGSRTRTLSEIHDAVVG